MALSVDGMLDDILRREGGFVDDPDDRGGATNYGVTIGTLSNVLGREATAADVKALTPEQAREIYRRDYYKAPHIDELPGAIQPFMFDAAVNHGPGGAAKLLQRALRAAGHPVAVDGQIGPQTIAAAQDAYGMRGNGLRDMLVDERRRYYERIIAGDPSQEKFRKGWMNRLAEFGEAPRA